MPETYPTGGAKNFIHGIDYQKLWLMLFFRRAVNRKYFFRLATEMSSAAGFDDIVFRYEQNGATVCMLIQVKHKQDDSKKICVGDLLTKSGELNLVKHFAAFLEIQGNEEFKDKIKDFFIVINVDFDYESLASKGITVEKIETQDEFLNIGDSAKYKLRDLHNNIAQYLEQGMSAEDREVSDEEIKGFLNELVFVVNLPSDVELEKLIRNEINDDLARRFKYFGDNGYVFNALFTMISNWMKDKRGRFLTPEEGKEFFQKVELWASTVSEIRQGVERIEGKVDEIGGVLNNQQARKEPIWFNMKYPVKTFTGRRSELQKIYKELHKTTNEQAEVSQIVVISGLGGIGKSELARKYAYEYRKDYDGNVIWINAETQKDLEGSFRGLAEELKKRLTEGSKISITEEGIKFTIKDVYRYFRNVESLFIFDNAKGYREVNKFLPLSFPDCKKPYVLITSHDTKWEVEGVEYEEGRIEVIRLGVLDETEAWEFVKRALNIENNLQDEKIRELTKELQYLPLALGQAVVYIQNRNEESKLRGDKRFEISDYLKEYKHQAEKLFEETESLLKKWSCDDEGVRYAKTVLTTWNVTIEAIKQKECSMEALGILGTMAYLAPDDICIKEIFSKLLIANYEERLWNAVKLLDRYSMINLREGIVNIHRLVQKVARLKLQKADYEEETLRIALELINSGKVTRYSMRHITSVWRYASRRGKLIDEFYFNSIYGRRKCTPLHSLAESGDYEAIKAILTHIEKKHPDGLNNAVNAKDKYYSTPLSFAAYNGKSDVVEYLISKGADVNVNDKYNLTPLHQAAYNGRVDIVKYIINKGADINAQSKYHGTPLHCAVESRKLDVVEYLVREGADINAQSNDYGTPLHCAVESGKLDVVKYLIRKGAGVNAKNKCGWSPLYIAAIEGRLEAVRCLVEEDADIDAGDKDCITPLHVAASHGNLKMVECLVEKDANINAKTTGKFYNSTPLHMAVRSLEVVKYLVEKGASLGTKVKYGITLLHTATMIGNLSVVKYLIEKGANVNAKSLSGNTPLYMTVHHGELDVIKYLINKGADVNAKNRCDDNILHYAGLVGSSEVVKYLIKIGIPVNAKNKDGDMPLHFAAKKGNIDVAKVLLKHNADVNAKNNEGKTALHYAAENRNSNVVKYFVEKGANVNAKDENGNTPLHFAAIMGNFDTARVLLKRKADVNAKNNRGMTALHYATDFDHRDLVELLLAHGASRDY